jgi:hypothetical protein
MRKATTTISPIGFGKATFPMGNEVIDTQLSLSVNALFASLTASHVEKHFSREDVDSDYGLYDESSSMNFSWSVVWNVKCLL